MEFKAMRKITTLALLLALAAPPGAEAAVRVVAPPGNSEADQYYQTLPGSAGPRAPAQKRTTEDAVRDGQLSPATARALERRGAEGAALATAVAKTAPPRGDGSGNASPPIVAGAAKAPAEQGLGGLFVPILAITMAASVAFFFARRRRPARR
jgi:hypothetical protein